MDKTQMRKLAAKVAAMSEDQRSELATKLPVITVERHVLSGRNAILCAWQFEVAPTVVGGFRQWQAAGRCVRKGEKAAYIMHPCTKKSELSDETSTFFRFAPIFDISQTDSLESI